MMLIVTSNYMGAVVNAMMGDTVETDHTIQVTAPGLPAVYYSLSGDGFRGSYGDYIPPGLFIRSLQIVNDKGQVIDAAKVGTPLAKPLVSELFLLYDDFTITPTGNLVLSGIVKTKPVKDGSVAYKASGGSVSGTVNLNNGKYQTTYTAGLIPALNTIEALGVADVSVPMVLYTNYMNSGTYTLPSFVRGTEPLREYPGKLAQTSYNPTQYTCSPTGCKLREKVMTFQTGQQAIFFTMDDPNYHYLIGQPSPTKHAVYGVSIVQNTGKVFLNKWGYPLNDLKFNYTISPPEYQAMIADVELYKDNDVVMYIAGETKGAGSATLARGAMFDMASVYSSRVVLNYGSDVEVRSDKKPIKVEIMAPEKIIEVTLGLTKQLRVDYDPSDSGSLLITPGDPSALVVSWGLDDRKVAYYANGRIEQNGLFRSIYLSSSKGDSLVVVDAGARSGTVAMSVRRPNVLGNTPYLYDNLIINYADQFGVEPQLIKAMIRQESNFDPNAGRYEPFYDRRYVAGKSRFATSAYRVTEGPTIYEYFNSHRASYPQALWGSKTLIHKYNTLVSTHGVAAAEEYLRNYLDYGRRDGSSPPTGMLPAIAQTRIAKSYGLIQVMYPTALDRRYPVSRAPEDLTIPAICLDLGVGYLRRQFVDTGNWDKDWNDSLLNYNGGSVSSYPSLVRRWIPNYLPSPVY